MVTEMLRIDGGRIHGWMQTSIYVVVLDDYTIAIYALNCYDYTIENVFMSRVEN